MTLSVYSCTIAPIIPYQELLGNYDRLALRLRKLWIIPYQELLGNYDSQL